MRACPARDLPKGCLLWPCDGHCILSTATSMQASRLGIAQLLCAAPRRQGRQWLCRRRCHGSEVCSGSSCSLIESQEHGSGLTSRDLGLLNCHLLCVNLIDHQLLLCRKHWCWQWLSVWCGLSVAKPCAGADVPSGGNHLGHAARLTCLMLCSSTVTGC